MLSRNVFLFVSGFFFLVFVFATGRQLDRGLGSHQAEGRVVLSAPVLLMIYGGDRFLASNVEVIRVFVTASANVNDGAGYLVRAQRVVSELNPCNEDNYYLANGLLTWGGAVKEGNDVLVAAMDCRVWDGVPGFFYGVNKAFFDRDFDEAERALRLSASRWPANKTALLNLAVMLRVNAMDNEKQALSYLVSHRNSTIDSRLRGLLDQRVKRLTQLIELRNAQRSYEMTFGPLKDLQQLVSKGFLKTLPNDPLGLGYQLVNGRIELKRIKIAGLEASK